MSNYTHEEQVQIVKKAMELEQAIQNENMQKNSLMKKTFKNPPNKPLRTTVNMNIKPVEPDYSAVPRVNMTFVDYLEIDARTKPNILNIIFSTKPFNRGAAASGILLASSFIFFVASSIDFAFFVISIIFGLLAFLTFIITLAYDSSKKSAYNQKVYQLKQNLIQQPHYIQAKADAENAAKEKQTAIIENLKTQQAELDRQYAEQKNHYETVTIVQYNQEYSKWKEEHDAEIKEVSYKLETDRNSQKELYETTRLIPMQYRDIKALTYLCQLMSTSEYDIKEAIDMYNKEIERQQNAMRIREQQRANALANEQNYRLLQQNRLLDEQNELQNQQNELQYQQNEIAEKQRRDDRRREIETEYHRHQIRKNLKSNK